MEPSACAIGISASVTWRNALKIAPGVARIVVDTVPANSYSGGFVPEQYWRPSARRGPKPQEHLSLHDEMRKSPEYVSDHPLAAWLACPRNQASAVLIDWLQKVGAPAFDGE